MSAPAVPPSELTLESAAEALETSASPANTAALAGCDEVPATSRWILSAPSLVLVALMACFRFLQRATGPFWGMRVPHHLQSRDPFWVYQYGIATALSLNDAELPSDIKPLIKGVFDALQCISPELLIGLHEVALQAVLDDLNTIQTQFKGFTFYPTLAAARILSTLERTISGPPFPSLEDVRCRDVLYPGGITLTCVARVINAFYHLHFSRTPTGRCKLLGVELRDAERKLDYARVCLTKHIERLYQQFSEPQYAMDHRVFAYYRIKNEILDANSIVSGVVDDGRFVQPAHPEDLLQKEVAALNSRIEEAQSDT